MGSGATLVKLDTYAPTHPQYAGLKTALSAYRNIKAAGGWLAIPEGEVLEEGETDTRIPAIRQRLQQEGYNVETVSVVDAVEDLIGEGAEDISPELVKAEITTFQAPLAKAIANFQADHGLEQDGVVGGRTLEAMNESVESKIDRVADTMARWRAQDSLGQRYVWANIPSYKAEGWADGKRELRMKTIVGMPSRAPPQFSDEIEYVVANPRWYAPVSITRRDKVPKLANDPGYAKAKNFKIYNRETGAEVSAAMVDWTDPAAATTYRLVQQPGPMNALGDMKIIFPNQYSVYIHGTPGKRLFDEAQRAFSSGCIRLENPAAMAQWISGHDAALDASEIEDALEADERDRLDLATSLPVHITYFTVTVGDDGRPNFWRDIYKEDDGIQFAETLAARYTLPDNHTALIEDAEAETRTDVQ